MKRSISPFFFFVSSCIMLAILADGQCIQAVVKYRRNWTCATTQTEIDKSCAGIVQTITVHASRANCKQKFGGCEVANPAAFVKEDQKWNCRQYKTSFCTFTAWRFRYWVGEPQKVVDWEFDSYVEREGSPSLGVKCDG
ncbi:hypothetical protein C8035_v009489 [Colletotrichum spinosum]|uniref:Avirulence Effector AvrLm4-7 domain-containing protein n=1 Tax=Colletotrichum spinosum TaxID=1347390 RepID=A0A4R8PR17_9PEZI|nr:hypothetical protein C8035_v009489 [Colletotrichum spinosum]